MKLKTSAIALAVAGTVATPMAVQADGSVYASMRIGLNVTQADKTRTLAVTAVSPTGVPTFTLSATNPTSLSGDDDDWRIQSINSRFGARGETDLGNGMTGFGRFEWDIDETGVDSARHRFAGVKGDFGSITVGKTWHTFFNHIIAPTDNPWLGSGYSVIEYLGRTDDTISYAGSSGAITFGASLVMSTGGDKVSPTVPAGLDQTAREDEDIDGIELGVTVPVGDLGAIAVAVKTDERDGDDPFTLYDDEEDLVGIAWHSIPIGDGTLGFSAQMRDDDDSLTIDFAMGGGYIHIETHSVDATDADRMTVTLGYAQSLGRNTTVWYELMSQDQDDDVVAVDNDASGTITVGDSLDERADFTAVRAILKYDIL